MKLKSNSEFNNNSVTLIIGTTIGQAIPIAISPILTRIYTPEDFGVFAVFLAITAIFSSIANARYELAIILPKKDEDAINVFAIGLFITILLSLFLLFFIIIFNDSIVSFLGNEEIGIWLYFVPVSVLFIGLFNLLNYFNTRKKNYKDIANTNIIKGVIFATIQLTVGIVKNGATGLISGQILSLIFANTKLLKNIFKEENIIKNINKLKMLALGKKYINFPKYTMPEAFTFAISRQLINILISALYSIVTLGFYSLSQRVVGLPLTIISNSVRQVFFQIATEEKNKTGNIVSTFNSTVKKLTFLGLPFFIIIFFTAESLFSFVFGEKWAIAGVYVQLLIPLYFIRFVVDSLLSTVYIFHKQKMSLYWQLSLFIFSILSIYFCHFYEFSFISFLYVYVTISILHYIILFLILKKAARGK